MRRRIKGLSLVWLSGSIGGRPKIKLSRNPSRSRLSVRQFPCPENGPLSDMPPKLPDSPRGATRSRRRTRPGPSAEAGLKAITCDGTAASKLANAEPLDFQGTGNPYQCGDLLENLPITGSVARRFSC